MHAHSGLLLLPGRPLARTSHITGGLHSHHCVSGRPVLPLLPAQLAAAIWPGCEVGAYVSGAAALRARAAPGRVCAQVLAGSGGSLRAPHMPA